MKALFLVFIALLECLNSMEQDNTASQSSMYKTYAHCYDKFYHAKAYDKESSFIDALLTKYQVKTVLDVGCGTGAHLFELEKMGYDCEGLDFNLEMIEVARKKIKGGLYQADMRNFNLNKKYDAILSLFAVFNHNLTLDEARNTLARMKSHLNEGGLLIIDLYNPQSSGEKTNGYEGITKVMRWQLNLSNPICESVVSFKDRDKIVCEEKFPLRIYSISEMRGLLVEAGFTIVQVFDNYTFEEASVCSKNLVFIAR